VDEEVVGEEVEDTFPSTRKEKGEDLGAEADSVVADSVRAEEVWAEADSAEEDSAKVAASETEVAREKEVVALAEDSVEARAEAAKKDSSTCKVPSLLRR
jgi:hypothetical protein